MSDDLPPGFQWDEDKNRANIVKHGVDFRDAVRIFEKPTLDTQDIQKDYGEIRTNSLGDEFVRSLRPYGAPLGNLMPPAPAKS